MGLRLDRLATLYIAGPLQLGKLASQSRIPILMYHSIAEDEQSLQHPYYRTSTTPAVFARQMAYLHESGYSTINPGDLGSHSHADPRKYVVLTFDDGFADFYGNAAPILGRHGFSATVYLPTAYVGDAPQKFNGKDCLSWAEVRELHRAGISFGSHTVTHPQLYGLDQPGIKTEITTSKQVIEQKLGCRVDSFAYPFAFPDADADFKQRLRDALCAAGYSNSVGTTIGRARSGDVFFMKRLPINSDDDLRLFKAKLAGSYDWLGTPQYLYKLAKKWAGSA